jgi:hypothetical protein
MIDSRTEGIRLNARFINESQRFLQSFLESIVYAGHIPRATQSTGGVVEWSIAPVLKTGEPKGSVGSNPTPSAIFGVSLGRANVATGLGSAFPGR